MGILKKIFDFVDKLMPRQDRMKHYFSFTVIFIFLNIKMPIEWALFSVFLGAFLKEVWDYFRKNGSGFDIIDFFYSVIAPVLIYIIF